MSRIVHTFLKEPELILCSKRAGDNKEEIFTCSILDPQKTILKSTNQIQILKLWNSSTPLFSELKRGFGGGYFLIWNGKGIVIDPGFNFIEIFMGRNRTIMDIDYVIITHDHPDHCGSLPEICTLLHEVNKKLPIPHIINFYVSKGTYLRYASYFRNKGIKNHVFKLNDMINYHLMPDIEISVIKNKHREISRSMGVGLKITLKYDVSSIYRIGITSDTGYFKRLTNFYNGVNLLILHIGTLENINNRKVMKNHLGFKGIVYLIQNLTIPPNIALISEWGEELRGLRKTIGDQLQKILSNTKILPADYLFRMSLPNNYVYISHEDRFIFCNNVYVSNDYGARLRYKSI